MTFFTSEYESKLDSKGRIVLPAKIKNNLPEEAGSEVVIGRGFDKCIFLYSMVEYNKIYAKIAALSGFNEENRKLKRTYFQGISVVELDANGRFLIPKLLLAYSGIERDAVVVGMGNYVEIWNPGLYYESLINDPQEFNALAQEKLDGDG
ncbi:MAG: division/cell wall cluster transcriptional repressor MraZ [Cyclobacteriaceae bacterium]|nr:division/cell wall cluster transcriptional repressor MraZ [Cyclobacteriaceae bacterium]